MLIAGAHLAVPAATTDSSAVVKMRPDNAWTNEVHLSLISVFLEHEDTSTLVDLPEFFSTVSWDANSIGTVKAIYVTTSEGTPFSRILHVPSGSFQGAHTFDFQMAGCILGSGTPAQAQQIIRVGESDYANGGTSIKFSDCVYDADVSSFRADAGGGFCTGGTAADFETNCDANAPGAIDIDNNLDDVGAVSQYVGGGFCDQNASSCAQIVPTDPDMFNDDWHETQWFPAWLTGKTLKGFRGNPSIQNDDGRQAANTLHPCVAGGPVPCGVL
jgi:hypothetical protein